MQVIKLRKKTANNIELITLVLTMYCLLSGIKVNKTEVLILAYLVKYGMRKSTKDIIVRSQILTYNSLENTITRLRKKGLIVRDRDGIPIVKPDISFSPENKMGVIVQLENL